MRKNGELFITDVEAPAVAVPYMNIIHIRKSFERGTAGLILHPDFPSEPYFYVYYASTATEGYRLSRFTHREGDASHGTAWGDLASEHVVWDSPEPNFDCCHFGGAMTIGPEGALYLATGDNFRPELAQDLSSPSGKILRIWLNGSAVVGNMGLDDGVGGNLDEIWAFGLRNPFSTTWDSAHGRLLIAEVRLCCGSRKGSQLAVPELRALSFHAWLNAIP
jgi:glucose/arabinose dehydrogenase